MITYETAAASQVWAIRVLLDGACVGMIRETKGFEGRGYYYAPKKGKVTGEIFNTVLEVKRSIEAA